MPAMPRHGLTVWAIVAAAAAGAALAAATLAPAWSAFLAPLAVIFGVAATRRVAAGRDDERAALAAENAELARALEVAADRAWELHESEERYRSLNLARERAEAANLAKSRFLAIVSHELRTPLNGILGLNSLLVETDLSPAQETYARGVQSSATALLSLIEDLLDFSKIEAGRLDIRPEPVHLEDVLADVATLLAGRAHQKGVDLAVDLDPAISAALRVDPARLRQVLVNLVGNAVKFTDIGSVVLAASLEAQAGGRARVSFTVSDTGPGIPPEDAERLFGEFEQADTALTRRHGGAGLGLAISRRIVESAATVASDR
jgi:signal transduction histidine kinase